MNQTDLQYKALVKEILDKYDAGVGTKDNRTGIKTVGVFGRMMRFNMADGFPLITLKKVNFTSMLAETIWFLQGRDDVSALKKMGSNVWNEWTLTQEQFDAISPAQRGIYYLYYTNTNEEFNSKFVDILSDPVFGGEDAYETSEKEGFHKVYVPGTDLGAIWINQHLATEFEKIYEKRDLEYQRFEKRMIDTAGPIYGVQWRNWLPMGDNVRLMLAVCSMGLDEETETKVLEELVRRNEPIDQLRQVLSALQNPKKCLSRRLVISAWNTAQLALEGLPPHHNVLLNRMALSPCHNFMQFQVEEATIEERSKYLRDLHGIDMGDGVDHTDLDEHYGHRSRNRLNLMVNLRSNDIPLGCPFNIAGYSIILMAMAKMAGMVPGELVYVAGDVHIYHNQIEPIRQILDREPRALPKLKINPRLNDLDDLSVDMFELEGYDPHPFIKMDVAV